MSLLDDCQVYKLKKGSTIFKKWVDGNLCVGLTIMSVHCGYQAGSEKHAPLLCSFGINKGNTALYEMQAKVFAKDRAMAKAILEKVAKDEGLTITYFNLLKGVQNVH